MIDDIGALSTDTIVLLGIMDLDTISDLSVGSLNALKSIGAN